MGKYYEDHPDQLSEKIKDQYDCDTEDKIFVVFFAVIIVIALLVGICI
jgi:hypothetical protein